MLHFQPEQYHRKLQCRSHPSPGAGLAGELSWPKKEQHGWLQTAKIKVTRHISTSYCRAMLICLQLAAG